MSTESNYISLKVTCHEVEKWSWQVWKTFEATHYIGRCKLYSNYLLNSTLYQYQQNELNMYLEDMLW